MNLSAILFAFLSALFMGTIGVFAKITQLPAEVIAFFRLMLGAMFMLLFLIGTGKKPHERRTKVFNIGGSDPMKKFETNARKTVVSRKKPDKQGVLSNSALSLRRTGRVWMNLYAAIQEKRSTTFGT